MADNAVFDPQKLLGSDLADCETEQILELVKKLCKIAARECGEDGYRGGFRPGNIYVTEDGRVAVGKPAKAGDEGWTKLELEFMAPEQFWNGEKSAAADVYSIALIMYAGLNGGKLPFIEVRDATAEQRANALRRRMSGDTLAMPDGVDEPLAKILAQALEFDPEKRYTTAADLLAAIWDYCGDTPEPLDAAEPEPVEEKQEPEETIPEPVETKAEPEPPKPAEEKKTAPEKKPEPVKKFAPEKKPAAEKKPVPEKKSEPEKVQEIHKEGIHTRRSTRRSIIVIAVIVLLLAAVAVVRNMDINTPEPSISATPEPTAVQTADPTPEPTAEPTVEPTPAPAEVQYMLYSGDLSWDAAEQKCIELGGHLATIKSDDDYARICKLLEGTSAQYVWIGGVRDADGTIKWRDGASYDYYAWAAGEPSLKDAYDGASEDYIMLVKQPDGTWMYNDSRNDPMADYARFYSGKIAYICQIE